MAEFGCELVPRMTPKLPEKGTENRKINGLKETA